MNCTQLTASLIAGILGTSCTNVQQTFKDKPQLMQFASQHPVAALSIGRDDGSTNITSSAIRLSTRIGLDNKKNGDGRGTQVNAIRHSLWQATIAARFGNDIAKKAGDAYEKNVANREATEYKDRYSADEAVDLRNNAIGRSIGAAHHTSNMNQLSQLLLKHYHEHGLWTATSVKEHDKTIWRISQTKLSAEQYEKALDKLKQLDEYGMTPAERAKLKAK